MDNRERAQHEAISLAGRIERDLEELVRLYNEARGVDGDDAYTTDLFTAARHVGQVRESLADIS